MLWVDSTLGLHSQHPCVDRASVFGGLRGRVGRNLGGQLELLLNFRELLGSGLKGRRWLKLLLLRLFRAEVHERGARCGMRRYLLSFHVFITVHPATSSAPCTVFVWVEVHGGILLMVMLVGLLLLFISADDLVRACGFKGL